MRRKNIYLVFIFISLMALVLFISVKKQQDPVLASIPKNPKDAANYLKWNSLFNQADPKVAYQKFKEQVISQTISGQHRSAHIFGELLYKKLGVKGITVCDESFAYGCYHSFLGTAINDKGLEIIPLLVTQCNQSLGKNKNFCPHGLGHGILTYLGYDFQNLKKALEICQTSVNPDPFRGCPGGVFMEYNFQTMLSLDAKTRKYDSDDPYYPCSALPDSFKKDCYFRQPDWWLNVLTGTLEEKFSLIDQLCSKLNDTLVLECARGLGDKVGQFTNWEVDKTRDLCNLLKTKNSQLSCLNQAAAIFRSGT